MPLQKSLLLLLLLSRLTPVNAQPFSKSETDESWALKQMQHMLADRPVMKSCRIGEQIYWLRPQDSIWQWAAERYSGKITGFWTAWHEAPPVEKFEAMHAYGQHKAYLYIREIGPPESDDHNKTFEALWSCAVFELFNLENAQGFSDLSLLAYEGKCTRIEYAGRMARLEHLAMGKQQQFFKDVWLPWCKATGFVSAPEIWQRNYHPISAKWLAQYPPHSRYPWQYYGEQYDLIRQAKEEAEKAGDAKAKFK
jgi:hypothetical protein